jgi:DsbC/DsbD-like thiol-disulfide interchange protein
MTRSTYITITCLLLLFVTTACSKPVQNSASESVTTPAASPSAQRITSESVVKVEAQPVEIPAGRSAEAVVRVTIQSGYHINANPPTYPYLKATKLEISPADGVSVGFITYPKALSKTFAFAEKRLAVYEGETELKATLKADKSAKPGQRSISASLRIQACDEQVCYPPGTLELAIPVNIKEPPLSTRETFLDDPGRCLHYGRGVFSVATEF